MAIVFIFVLSFISVFMTPATSQLNIVSVKTIEDGSPFTITCNAQRVVTSQTANFTTISSLQIDIWNNGADGYKKVAQYLTYTPPDSQKEVQFPPAGRNWKFNFSGSNTENSGRNNAATMKIEILVPTGKCEDAGLYKCTMVYYSSGTLTDSSEQNVTSTATTTEPLVLLDPVFEAPAGVSNTSTYVVGANVTVTCRFQGPEQLGIKWKRERRPAIGIDVQFDDYTIANDITTDTPTRVPGTSATCPQYSHTSVLKLTISSEDDNRQYQCVVVSGEEEQASSAVLIQVNEGNTPPPSGVSGASTKPDNIGLIVGVVIGCVVAVIIIIVIIVICCLRSKRNKKSEHDTDRPDGGHNQPAPPPVLYSRPNKGINNNNNIRDSKIPAGKVNEALDNSYDSKDSGYKAPPVYTITNQRQAYPGRQNQAYDPEDNSANRQPQESDPRYYNYETRPPVRRYSTDDNTDVHRDYYEDENFGTGV